MNGHKQVVIPVGDDAHDVSIISYEVEGETKWEIAIMGPEGIYHDDVRQFRTVAQLQQYLNHYFGEQPS